MLREAPKGFTDLLPVWNKLAIRLQMTYVALGFLATASSLGIATFTADIPAIWLKIISYLLALSLALISAFELGSKANGARAAWRILNQAVLAYENDESYTFDDLNKQYAAGEALLGDVRYVAPSSTTKHPARVPGPEPDAKPRDKQLDAQPAEPAK